MDSNQIEPLSKFTTILLEAHNQIKNDRQTKQGSILEVSEAASLFAVIYEKLRNVIEYREEHLLRRAAIERILVRRLSVNLAAVGEGENLCRELLWSRYVERGSLTTFDAENLQRLINKYLELGNLIKKSGRVRDSSELVIPLLSCQIEEYLSREDSAIKQNFLYYLYQTNRRNYDLTTLPEAQRELYFYAACERSLLKNNDIFIIFHLLNLKIGSISELEGQQLTSFAYNLPDLIRSFKQILTQRSIDQLVKVIGRNLPAYRVLFDIIEKGSGETILTDETKLVAAVEEETELRKIEIQQKLKQAGVRSVLYIFLTKMILVLLLELPLSHLIYNHFNLFPTIVNTLFPPLLMSLIVITVRPPSEENTRQILQLINSLIYQGDTLVQKKSLRTKERRPVLRSFFYTFYSGLYFAVFIFIYFFLEKLGFNLINKIIFVLFMSLIVFFGYRVRQISKEYSMSIKDNLLTPIIDTFFLPILSLGKALSRQVAKLNFLMFLFDVIIEAPIKLFSEIIEEWRDFTRQKKEDLL